MEALRCLIDLGVFVSECFVLSYIDVHILAVLFFLSQLLADTLAFKSLDRLDPFALQAILQSLRDRGEALDAVTCTAAISVPELHTGRRRSNGCGCGRSKSGSCWGCEDGYSSRCFLLLKLLLVGFHPVFCMCSADVLVKHCLYKAI